MGLSFQGNAQLIQLIARHCSRRIDHHIAARSIFREGDVITDRIRTAKEGTQTVETKGNATVGRGSVFKGVHQEAKLRFGFFLSEAQVFKHQLLSVPVVYSD
mgnify:CR=1 FL=1